MIDDDRPICNITAYRCSECGEAYASMKQARECARLDLDPRREPHRRDLA